MLPIVNCHVWGIAKLTSAQAMMKTRTTTPPRARRRTSDVVHCTWAIARASRMPFAAREVPAPRTTSGTSTASPLTTPRTTKSTNQPNPGNVRIGWPRSSRGTRQTSSEAAITASSARSTAAIPVRTAADLPNRQTRRATATNRLGRRKPHAMNGKPSTATSTGSGSKAAATVSATTARSEGTRVRAMLLVSASLIPASSVQRVAAGARLPTQLMERHTGCRCSTMTCARNYPVLTASRLRRRCFAHKPSRARAADRRHKW